MSKIFLSHSSKDKTYVNFIAEHFGKDRCVYDEMCFEVGMKNIDEIFSGIDSTSIFVIFLSNNSLNSDWVELELNEAETKLKQNSALLSQIFPIIIDESINHNDPRIPDFLKKGFGSYNLRFIKNKKIACKKIETQYYKRLYENKISYKNSNTFYGRSKEIAEFTNAFDSGKKITCFVAYGVNGIGRKSYLIESMRKANIIKRYYEPSIISLARNDTIDDVIMKIVEMGFGDYSLEEIIARSMNEKIEILKLLFVDLQNQNEYILIYDDMCLIDFSGEVRYWFNKAINDIRSEVTISIASRASLSYSFCKSNPNYFTIELYSLPFAEWNGLMRVYAEECEIEFTKDDRLYFKDIITGYPPQVINCVDTAKNYNSVEYVKRNSYEIVEKISEKVTQMIEVAFKDDTKDFGLGFLSFLSAYGTVPISTVYDILQIEPQFKEILHKLKSLTICRIIGSSGDYIEINPVIGDYIQRSSFKMPKVISDYLKSKVDTFYNHINDNNITDFEDFESIKYYLKEYIKAGKKDIPDKLLYSTLYINSVRELYDKQEYTKVISIISKLKSDNVFDRFDLPIQEQLQRYYCRALARETDDRFYVEVEFFKNSTHKDLIEYDFLRGFMFRQNAEYDKALDRYSNILSKKSNHRSTMREIVIVYRGLEDYSSCREIAKINYTLEPNNPFQIQPYFDILMKSHSKTDEELEHINEILDTIQKINELKPIITYYEIMAQYSIYVEKNKSQALGFLKAGQKEFPDSSYIAKALFDCYDHYLDIKGMEQAFDSLRKVSNSSKSAKIALNIREVILDAYQGKPKITIAMKIAAIKGITDETRDRLNIRIEKILSHTKQPAFV